MIYFIKLINECLSGCVSRVYTGSCMSSAILTPAWNPTWTVSSQTLCPTTRICWKRLVRNPPKINKNTTRAHDLTPAWNPTRTVSLQILSQTSRICLKRLVRNPPKINKSTTRAHDLTPAWNPTWTVSSLLICPTTRICSKRLVRNPPKIHKNTARVHYVTPAWNPTRTESSQTLCQTSRICSIRLFRNPPKIQHDDTWAYDLQVIETIRGQFPRKYHVQQPGFARKDYLEIRQKSTITWFNASLKSYVDTDSILANNMSNNPDLLEKISYKSTKNPQKHYSSPCFNASLKS